MRKIYYLAAALLLTSVVGCQEEIASNEPEKVVIETVYATFEDGADTRTSLNDKNQVLWSEGDMISVFGGNTANKSFKLEEGYEGTTYGEFTFHKLSAGTESDNKTVEKINAVVAYYPYDGSVTVSESESEGEGDGNVYTINATFPATQTYSESGTFGNGAAPAVAVTSSKFDSELKFKNVGSVIKVNLKGDATITKVVFSANADLAGNCNITASNTAVPTVEVVDGSQAVTIDCGEGVKLSADTATEFVATILPIACLEGGMTVSFYDNNGKKMDYTYGAGNTIEIKRSMSYTMPEQIYNGTTPEIVVKTAEELRAAIEAAEGGETIMLSSDIELKDILVIDKNITLDGNGKILTSTAERAINVSGAGETTIQNLTINASGERAINIIKNSEKVFIKNVTATAANYTVNVAASAPGATVTINNSTLTGLNVVNVSSPGAEVTVTGSTLNCNDKNASESYAALCLNKDAVGAKITATGCTINIPESSGSSESSNGAEGGEIIIDGSSQDEKDVAAILYGDYYYSYPTLASALEAAKAGETVTLLRDVESSERLIINKDITLDGNGKTLNSTADRAFQITGGTVIINDLTVNMPENTAEGNRGINIYNGETNQPIDVTLNDVTVNGYKAYAVNIGGGRNNNLTINGSTLTGYAAINVHTSSVNHTIKVDGSTLNGRNHNDKYHFGTVVIDGDNTHSLVITNTTVTKENLEGVTSNYYEVLVGANCAYQVPEGIEVAVRNVYNETDGLYYIGLEGAVKADAKLKLHGNVKLNAPVTIGKDVTVTLDLNGNTISQEKECTASYEMINNKGTLKITGNGKISFKDTSAGDPSFGWGSYTIRNEGNLIVENGTIEHLGAQDFATHMICAIFQYSGSTTINGGTISTPNYRSARLWKGDMTINGGEFDGQLWVQAVDNSAALTINGGTFGPNGRDGSSVFVGNADHNVALAVNGGTFTTKIGCSDVTKEGVKGSVKGGVFTEAAKNGTNSALIAEGYDFAEAAGGNWTVSKATKSWDVNGNTYTIYNAKGMQWFANEVNVNKNTFAGKTVILANNIDLNNENWVPVGQTGATQFVGTFDGNGKTISNLNIDQTAQEGANYSTGIFGWLNKATVKNVKVNGAKVKGNHNVGVIAGYLETSGCTIENCHVSNAVIECQVKNADANGDKCGAIVGHAGNAGVVVKDCTATNCTISAGRDAGQVVGAAKAVNVTGCSASNVTVTANGKGTGANIRNEVIGRLL